jgi:hypothetical protein
VFKIIIVKTFHEALDVMCATARYRIGCKGFVTCSRICVQVVYKKTGLKGLKMNLSNRLLSYRPIAKQLGNLARKLRLSLTQEAINFRTLLLTFFIAQIPLAGWGWCLRALP